MNSVDVTSLSVVRAQRPVLRDLGFTIARGGIVGLLGPSGSGKTTLMRCLVGVQRIDEGAIHVLGLPAGRAELRSRIGYVTQAPSVYRDLTVTENLVYFARMLGCVHARVDEVIEAVSLQDHRADRVDRLSGGQQSRVSLAAALLGNPEVLVLDEPTVGLDPLLRNDLWAVFRLLAEAGATLLVSSHVMDEADRCDRVLLLREGRLLADDTPGGLRQQTDTTTLDAAFVTLAQAEVAT